MKLAKETALYNEGAVEQVSETADTAKTIATNTAQYFWTSSDGTDNGAHITETPKEQFESNPSGGNLLATTNGIAVRDGLTERAQFGETVVIGETTNTHQEMDYHSLKLIDKECNTYFYVSDLRGSDGKAHIVDKFSGGEYRYWLTFTPTSTNYTVTGTNWGSKHIVYKGTEYFDFDDNLPPDATVIAEYDTESGDVKAYTIGMRGTGDVGASSSVVGTRCVASGKFAYAEGLNTTAEGYVAHAEGYSTTASNTAHAEGYFTTASEVHSHAEGYYTTASGGNSHAEGSYTAASGGNSHAEGYATTASGYCSHAEGEYSNAEGKWSHAGGYFVTAQGSHQTAIGKYNKINGIEHAFIVGNGTSNSNRSNALTVDWNGNEVIAGTLTQSSDRRLKKHVAYLDEDAVEFIRKLKPAHFVKDEGDHVGFYAQDVEKEDKWNCMTGEMNGYKTLGYTEIIAPLVAYCQHLEARINELERKQNG